ncbi:hypothetical protein O181_005549 [Austropuccinia psidii MF-1]|uniref:Reverse transcriptase Ty1/copia-type domain-containing protein n=1 Tax=Austropuccinia psidii MF-1 TaxID=1389203 RepID=A0A9Q3GFZ8_9BASI|nr:hypothetical protein [Austropuccinia psidii MF-1]
MASPKADAWMFAIQKEFASLERYGVLKEVTQTNDLRLLSTTWVFREKTNAHGNLLEEKAQLYIRGFLQVEGLDFHDPFAATGRLATLCFLLGYCAEKDLDLHQMNVKTAFLHGDLNEVIHISLPEGYQPSGSGDLCLRLKKSLYGLCQSPRNWYFKIKTFFLAAGF